MKFSAREDVDAAVDDVWSAITDFARFEAAARGRGVQVTRLDRGGQPGWQVVFSFRGKPREVDIRQARANRPEALGFAAQGKAFEGDVSVELAELGPRRTRLTVTSEMRARTLAARLFVQSLKLARGRIMRRYQNGVARLAAMIEARAQGRDAGF